MQFQFPLERLLRVRKIREKQKQRELAMAKRSFDSETEKLNAICAEEGKTLALIAESTAHGENPAYINIVHKFLENQRLKKRYQRTNTDRAERKLSSARNALVETMRAKKTVEKLREHRKAQHAYEVQRLEQKQQDETGAIHKSRNSTETRSF
ncbi:flagellar export protein FliJ [candidate division KSB1 bacterium RBG_16_48_16]|nr:MAG: flagellar export protein FliJ [candidate division KSB1 bacterium RBG_16_48_16]